MFEFKGEMSVEEEKGNSSMCYKVYRRAILRNSFIRLQHMVKNLKKLFNFYTFDNVVAKVSTFAVSCDLFRGTISLPDNFSRKMLLHFCGKVQ